MHETIEQLRRSLLPVKAGSYLLGLSGGADSTALLMMLLADIRSGRIRVTAVHVNHGLRGSESDGDERFCAEMCRNEGVPIRVFRADLGANRDEASARAARYAFFRKCREESGADGLLLAHHADDQAETFMMRLLRGAGPEGLECMKGEETANGMLILRPMLSLGRKEIRNALRTDGIPWREDSSNGDSAYFRNRIRKELMPLLESFSGTATAKICRAAELIGKDNDALDRQAEQIYRRLSHGWIMDAETLANELPALRGRVLRRWWTEEGPERKEHTLSSAQTEALDSLLGQSRGKINLPGGRYAVRSGKHLFLCGGEAPPPEPETITGAETVFGGYRLTESVSAGDPGDGKKTQEVPADFTRGCVIRTRRPGDRIRPFGSAGSRKLQDYLTDRRIAEPFRDRIPLVCRGQEVLLVCGVGAGNIPEWHSLTAPVRLTWQGDMPWMDK